MQFNIECTRNYEHWWLVTFYADAILKILRNICNEIFSYVMKSLGIIAYFYVQFYFLFTSIPSHYSFFSRYLNTYFLILKTAYNIFIFFAYLLREKFIFLINLDAFNTIENII